MTEGIPYLVSHSFWLISAFIHSFPVFDFMTTSLAKDASTTTVFLPCVLNLAFPL